MAKKKKSASLDASQGSDEKTKDKEAESKEETPNAKGAEKEKNQPEDEDNSKSTSSKEGEKWYVVNTYAGHENKVATTLKQKIKASKLEDKILDVIVPTQEKIEIREGKKVTLQEKIFPGYILVKLNLDNTSWYAVRSTPGVTGFVGIGNKPTALSEKEVETIQQFSKMEAPTYKTSFSVGEAIKIIDGPFSDFIGSVEELDEEKGKLKVLVSIFGRETPVELDFLQVSKL